MTVDFGNLIDLVEKGLTQPVKSAALEQAVPANLRGAKGEWFALSLRARVLYAAQGSRRSHRSTYEQLADPKWKGKICSRSGQHPYNTALVAAFIAHHGEAKAEAWLSGVKANLARKATGGDRDVARDIMGGICDIGLANSYYVGLMRSGRRRRRAGEVGRGDQGDPADVRRRRHPRQRLRRGGCEACPEPRRGGEVPRVPRVRRRAEDLRRSELRVPGQGRARSSIRSSPRSAS